MERNWFGTSSHTQVRVVGARQGKPLTCNDAPRLQCVECERPARWLCYECMVEHDEPGTLCDTHAQGHPHADYGEPVPLVNSPRTGMCGYVGPADPPY
jgi:hypothetical protein